MCVARPWPHRAGSGPIERLINTVRARNPLPPGTVAVGAGLVVNGVTTYAFLVVARRALGQDAYGALAVVWGLVYILGPGLFQPLEQELARATAHRASRGQGSAPVLERAALIGGAEFLLVAVGVAVAWPLGLGELLDHRASLGIALVAALGAFAAAELVRGVIAGRHRFGAYGRYFAAEGISRLALGIVGALAGVAAVGAYAGALAGAFVAATLVAVGRERPLVRPGPQARWRELTPALGLLLATSLAEAFLLNVGPVAVEIIGGDELGPEAPGVFLNALIISRIPLFFFQAVKASLLPHLAALVGRGDLEGFRDLQLRLLGAVSGLAVLALAAMAALGPVVVEVLFGDPIGSRDMALLAASGGGLMVMLSLALGLVALGHTRLAVVGWFAAVVAFPLTVLTAHEPFLRVELALLVSVATGTAVTGALLRLEYVAHARRGGLTTVPPVPTEVTGAPARVRETRPGDARSHDDTDR
ncbi:MAG: hypothetical protein D6683_13955 [Actinomyces sp.]|nr:MAG: hypothetical protein D6683_13955 [Actinomyces sp.]